MKLFSVSDMFASDAKESVGVDIGYGGLALVRISRFSGQAKIGDYAIVPFEEGISKHSPEFPDILKSALANFCGSPKKKDIWIAISSVRTDIRYLKIPNVSADQIGNAVYWTYKRETSFDESEYVFTFDVLTTPEEKKDKIEVMACTALKTDIEKTRNLFAGVGFPLTGISLYPFIIQNLFESRWMDIEDSSLCTLWIGRTISRIDIFFPGGRLAMSRSIRTSERSMAEAIREHIGTEEYEIRAAPLLFEGLISGTLPSKVGGLGAFGEEAVFAMIRPALDRLVRQLERTFDHYNVNICKVPVGRIYVSGSSAHCKPLLAYISGEVAEGIRTSAMNPLVFAETPNRPGQTCSPAEKWHLIPPTGLALSDNRFTPNFLLTYADKEKLEKIFFVRRIVIAIFVVVAMAFGGFWYWQGRVIAKKENDMFALRQELEKHLLPAGHEVTKKLRELRIPFRQNKDRILLSENMLNVLSERIRERKQHLKDCAARYAGIAALSEVIRLTPKDIRLTGITVSYGLASVPVRKEDAEKDKAKNGDIPLRLAAEGVARGRHSEFENILNKYVSDLGTSPILSKTAVIRKSPEIFDEQEVLRFEIRSEPNRN